MNFPRRSLRLSLAALVGLTAAVCAHPVVLTRGELPATHAAANGLKSPGWLGVAMEKPKSLAGVIVTRVIRGSPAERKGVRLNDRIVKVDGKLVADPVDVSNQVAAKGAGKSVVLELVRDAQTVTVSVDLMPRPTPEQVFRMDMVGRKITSLPPLKIASGTGPVAYPALDGHVVLLDLFATWCGACLQLGPYYQAMHVKYATQGLTVLAISDESASTLAGWATQNRVTYTLAQDTTSAAFATFSSPAIPASLVVDKHGVIREVEVGFELGQVQKTEALIQVLLKEP
jgi:membrane-associated protease RseP (regulator of RpoE activity)